MTALIEGMGWGLLMSILVGPIFFTILQTGIEHGTRAGISLSAGQWLSDVMYISLVLWGGVYLEMLVKDEAIQAKLHFYLGLGGSVVLAMMGLAMLLTKTKLPENGGAPIKKSSLWGFLAKGWLINTVNPAPIVFWTTLVGTSLVKGYNYTDISLLLAGVMLSVVVTDGLKVYAAKRIRSWLNPRYLAYVRYTAAGALLVFSLLLMIKIIVG